MPPDQEHPQPTQQAWDVDTMWSRVRARTLDASTQHDPAAPARKPGRRVWAFTAAACVILIVGALELPIFVRRTTASRDRTATPAQYTTSRGQFATVHLTDGSEVTLAPESRLTISARFGDTARALQLDGEAIFSVHHDPAHPFKVSAGGALIEDIGTRFDLRAYRGDAAVTIAVEVGSVSLAVARSDSAGPPASSANVLVLASGDVGTLDRNGKVSAARAERVSSYFGWASGRLSFVDRPLPEVLLTIGRWYDLDVRVPDARLAHRLVNAEFARKSPAQMIDALALAMDATVERSGRVITLRPR